jgi:hypothetical protein
MLCSPAIVYLILCSIQIILDLIYGLYNTAFVKFFVTIIITIALDLLCYLNLGFISWIFVLIPFIFMTFIVSLILFIFGWDAVSGKSVQTTYNNNYNNPKPVIKSPPYPPWMLPNTPPETDYLMITQPNAITTIPLPSNQI